MHDNVSSHMARFIQDVGSTVVSFTWKFYKKDPKTDVLSWIASVFPSPRNNLRTTGTHFTRI